jgi:hypothetical protein
MSPGKGPSVSQWMCLVFGPVSSLDSPTDIANDDASVDWTNIEIRWGRHGRRNLLSAILYQIEQK